VVPALADVGTLRRLADGVQSQASRQFFKLMKILADRRLGFEPGRFGLTYNRPEFDLH